MGDPKQTKARRPIGGASSGTDRRARVLEAHGASAQEAGELLAYGEASSRWAEVPAEEKFPLADEPSVAAWQSYADRAPELGLLESLRRALIQLRFPVSAGLSSDDAYLEATRRGILPPSDTPGLELAEPDGLRLLIHPTPAGHIPVLVASAREDFVALVQTLTCRNEPQPIPDSVGASIVGGYNNWSRVRALRRRWQREGGELGQPFARLLQQKELYQDRFVLLSSGPYSGIHAQTLGLSPQRWQELSLTIRLEHECAHYFTRRVLGSMRNTLHDELLADYAGLTSAGEPFRSDWFLLFLGLEDLPRLRSGGRLQSYRGDPPLSDGALAVLARLVQAAARNLEQADVERGARATSLKCRGRRLLGLARLTLEDLASPEGVALAVVAGDTGSS